MNTFHGNQRKGAGCRLPPIDIVGTTWTCDECGQEWVVSCVIDNHEYTRPYRAWVHRTDDTRTLRVLR